MKISGYYIYNNVAITAFAIMSMLSVSPRIPLSKVALLMPILLDDNITQKMTYQNYNSFDSVVTQNQVYLSNFNDRYIDEPTLKSKACLKCLYFTKIISDLCRNLEYFSYLYTIN